MEVVAGSVAPSSTPSDIVWEVAEIAKVIGRTDRQTFHMLAAGHLPARKVGGRWVASRRKLLAAVLGEEAA